MIRLVTVCDPHMSAHSPAAWKADYQLTILDVMEQILAQAARAPADAILVAGDFFHLKPAHRNPLGFLVRVSKLLKSCGIPVYGVAGNHDLRTGSIWNGGLEGQPLEALCEMGAVTLLDGDPIFIKDREHNRAGGCWIQGASFEHAGAETFAGLSRQDSTHPHVHLGHFGFSPRGSGDLFGERIYGPDELGSAFDVAVIGHHHFDQGVVSQPAEEFGSRWFMAHGSPCWTSCHKADADRRPAFGMIEIQALGKIFCRQLYPTLKPFADLIDIEKRELIQAEEDQLEEFSGQLSERLLQAPDPEAVLDDLDAVEQDVRLRAKEYLTAAEDG